MAFLVDTQELKPGLIVFRRGDVKHRGWYCRIKLPSMDRYKTVSLKTADVNEGCCQTNGNLSPVGRSSPTPAWV